MVSATVYAVGNVLSSVALVLLNKRVFAGGFAFPMALSGFHFCFTVVWYALLEMVGVYSKPSSPIPLGEKFKVALAGFASIGFMNLSLTYNSVGFYQARSPLPPPTHHARESTPRPARRRSPS